DKLVAAEQKLTTRVEAFRTQKETIKAQYTAAEAETRIGESLSGVSEDMADVGMAMDRATDKVETMQARAGAIDELLESGDLVDASVRVGTPLPVEEFVGSDVVVPDRDTTLAEARAMGADEAEGLIPG